MPCAHAPAFASEEGGPSINVSPKAAAEELGYTFLPCVLAYLHRWYTYLPTFLPTYLHIYTCVSLICPCFTYLLGSFARLFARLSIYPPLYTSTYPPIYISTHLPRAPSLVPVGPGPGTGLWLERDRLGISGLGTGSGLGVGISRAGVAGLLMADDVDAVVVPYR